jgi:hypothetical protein
MADELARHNPVVHRLIFVKCPEWMKDLDRQSLLLDEDATFVLHPAPEMANAEVSGRFQQLALRQLDPKLKAIFARASVRAAEGVLGFVEL